MTRRLPPLVVAIVRAWTRAYTWGLPAPLREARRAEIESDLWEFQHDVSRRTGALEPALHVLSRLLLGIPDDIWWRAAHSSFGGSPLRAAAAIAVAALALTGLWVYMELLRPQPLPQPRRPGPVFLQRPPPPPPPPPPATWRPLRR